MWVHLIVFIRSFMHSNAFTMPLNSPKQEISIFNPLSTRKALAGVKFAPRGVKITKSAIIQNIFHFKAQNLTKCA